jgi:hypothetical protein
LSKQTVRCIALVLAIVGAGAFLALLTVGVAASSAVVTTDSAHTAAVTLAASPPITLPSPCWRIGIITDGLYRLSHDALDAAGAPVADADPDDIHLLWRGQEMALQEDSDGDTAFESGESFLFYGQKLHGSVQEEKYTDENVYWVYVDDSSPGVRMSERAVTPGGGGYTYVDWYTATAHAEENGTYWARWTDDPGDAATWFWTEMAVRKTILTFTYPITLSAPASVAYSGTLKVQMASDRFSDYVHHVRLSLNGTVLGDVTWLGDKGYTATLPVDEALLQEGTNDVDITVVAPTENHDIYLNWIEIDYRRLLEAEDDALVMSTPISGFIALLFDGFSTSTIHLYDISQPLAQTHLTGAFAFQPGAYALIAMDTVPAGTTYLAVAEGAVMDVVSLTVHYPANGLTDPAEGADEIIIVPTEFITAVQPLSGLRHSQGLRVQVVDVNDIYDLFNGGIVHPEAIRSFVAHAYANWPGAPVQYLLLFGDGDINPKGFNPATYGEHAPTLIPPYLEFADPGQGEVAVDARFGDIDWDGMPEVMVGRIPAGTVQQAEDAVAKILAYERTPVGAWSMRAIMVTDNGKDSPEGFEDIADGLVADYIPNQMDAYTIHLRDYCGAATTTTVSSPCPSATLAVTQTWSQGASLLTYVGHAAVYRWGHEPLLLNTQMVQLTNTTGLPFLVSLDCWDGNWMWPIDYPIGSATDARSMGEWATTVLTDRGAIAAFGPSGLGLPDDENTMARAMYQAMFEEGINGLGELTMVGREAISDTYTARTYTLLGDPAMLLRVNLSPRAYVPLVIQGN